MDVGSAHQGRRHRRPGLRFLFWLQRTRTRIPIQLWGAADDRHQPPPNYVDKVRADLPQHPEYHVVANAGHYDFLPPCGTRLSLIAPIICTSPSGFDRAKFHELFNSEVVRFFAANLQPRRFATPT